MKMMTDEGIKVIDGSAYERDGVGSPEPKASSAASPAVC